MEPCCPWCEAAEMPAFTKDHLDVACFRYADQSLEKQVERNPLMCTACYGVGGYEDFGLDNTPETNELIHENG